MGRLKVQKPKKEGLKQRELPGKPRPDRIHITTTGADNVSSVIVTCDYIW